MWLDDDFSSGKMQRSSSSQSFSKNNLLQTDVLLTSQTNNKQTKETVSMTTSNWWQCNFIAKGHVVLTRNADLKDTFSPLSYHLYSGLTLRWDYATCSVSLGSFFSLLNILCAFCGKPSQCVFCSLKVSHEQSGFAQCLVFSFWNYTSTLASRR